jgi:hypothetical protein
MALYKKTLRLQKKRSPWFYIVSMIDLAKQKMFHIGFGLWLIDKDIAFFVGFCVAMFGWSGYAKFWINFIGDHSGSPSEIEHGQEKQFLARSTH